MSAPKKPPLSQKMAEFADIFDSNNMFLQDGFDSEFEFDFSHISDKHLPLIQVNENDNNHMYDDLEIIPQQKVNGINSKKREYEEISDNNVNKDPNPLKKRKLDNKIFIENFNDIESLLHPNYDKLFSSVVDEIEFNTNVLDGAFRKIEKAIKKFDALSSQVENKYKNIFPSYINKAKGLIIGYKNLMDNISKLGGYRKQYRIEQKEQLMSSLQELVQNMNEIQVNLDNAIFRMVKYENKEIKIDESLHPTHISHVNMEQGDCTLILTPRNKTIMIDCGSSGSSRPHYGLYNEVEGKKSKKQK